MKEEQLPLNRYYICPKGARKIMRNAEQSKCAIYLYSATGYGKTAFVKEFLKNKSYCYYDVEQVDFFTEIEAIINTQNEQIVVIDNLFRLEAADERERCYPLIETLLRNNNTWLIIISRSSIPAWLKPLHIRYVFTIIGEKDLSLSRMEMEKYFTSWGLSLQPETLDRIDMLGQGHPMFFKIQAMGLHSLPEIENPKKRREAELAQIEVGRKDWWDYIITEYDKLPVVLQEFLMDMSFLDCFDLQMAEMVSKKSAAGELIVRAMEMGNFVTEYEREQKKIYEIRLPLRLAFKQRLERIGTKAHKKELYNSAGNVYECQGKIMNAMTMYEKSGNREGILRLLIENVRKYVGVGCYWEMRKYYQELPEATVRQSPELMMGMSLLSSVMLDDEASEKWYQELEKYAHERTGSAKKEAQALLLYLDIALPHRGTKDMAATLKRAWKIITQRKNILPEVSLTNNQPSMMNGGKDFCEWSKSDEGLAKEIGKLIEILLGKFGKGLVELALGESFFEKGRDNYEVASLLQRGQMKAQAGGKQEQIFVAVGLMAQLSTMNNHIRDALESLESFKNSVSNEAPQLLRGIELLRIRLLCYLGFSEEITAWMEQAPDEDAEFCSLQRAAYLLKARIYLMQGRYQKAHKLLNQMLIYAKKRERIYIEIEATILLAVTEHRMGEKTWKNSLQNAIAQAGEYHFVRVFSKEGAAVWNLIKREKFKWQSTEYASQIKKECRYMAEIYPDYLQERQAQEILLTDREITILRMQQQGKTIDQIADILGLSVSGVKYHNRETYAKLGVNGKAAAITEALNRGLI